MQTSSMQIPPPSDWQDFEKLCCDLWSRIWEDSNACGNGRQGQLQNGVDIFGRPQKGDKWAGVQCKGKDNYTDNVLTKDEVEREVEKAKGFQPKLSEYIIATSGPRDAKIQEVARKLSKTHGSLGLFSVSVSSWQDIVLKLHDYPELLNKYYPEILTTTQISKKMDGLLEVQTDSHARQETILSDIGQKVARMESQVDGIRNDKSDYNERIDWGRDLIKKHTPVEAIAYYKDLKSKIWNKAQASEKYRVLTNLGLAELALSNESDAAKYLLEAFQYNSADDKAICNRAYGHYLLGQISEALAFTKTSLEKNPANCHAYSLQIKLFPPEYSFETILEKIPEAYRSNPEVACSLAFSARDRKLFDVARKWTETALENDPDKSPNLKAALATALIDEVSHGELVVWFRVNTEQKTSIKRAIELYTAAWDAISETAHKKAKASWLANRSLAKRVLNDIPGVKKDLELLSELDPENPDYIKRRALLAYETEDFELAAKLLGKIQNNPLTPEAALLLADILAKQNKKDEAIILVKKVIDKNNPKLADPARELLMQLYISADLYADAKVIAKNILDKNPEDVFALLIISKEFKELEERLAILLKANQYVRPSTNPITVQALADEFYSLGQWDCAISLYENCIGDAVLHPRIRNFVLAYYQAGKHGKALELCETALKQPKPPEYMAEIAASIYEEIGNLEKAKLICQECLKNYPDSVSIKLRLALISYRRNDFSDVDLFLNSKIDVATLTVADGAFLALLYLERNNLKKALEIMYEIRRKYYQEDAAHLKYIGILLQHNKPDPELLKVPEVAVDNAVLVRNESGEKTWYIVENRAHYERGEISPSSSLGKMLMGKKVGEQIAIKEGSGLFIQIEDIKNKYVHAFQDSMANFNQMFPENNSMVKMQVEVPQKDGEFPKGFQKIISQLEQQNTRIKSIVDLYKDGKLTMGGFAALSGKNIWEVWLGLMASPELGLRCCTGTAEERAAALSDLNTPTRLVCDILALFTLAELKMGDVAVQCFGKPAIAQSTIDTLTEIIKDRKTFPRTMTLMSENSRLQSQQHDQEWEKENIRKLETLLEWVKQNCEVVPATASLDEKNNRLVDLEGVLGKSFLDSVFIAKGINGLLYTEDERLRSLAKTEFGISGVWTQALLIKCVEKNCLSKLQYDAATIKLLVSRYSHITFNADVIVQAAQQAKWLPAAPFDLIVSRLGEQYCNWPTALSAGVNAMYAFYQQPILPNTREQLILAIINSLMAGRSGDFLGYIKRAIKLRFQLLPIAEREIFSLILAWKKIHLR